MESKAIMKNNYSVITTNTKIESMFLVLFWTQLFNNHLHVELALQVQYLDFYHLELDEKHYHLE